MIKKKKKKKKTRRGEKARHPMHNQDAKMMSKIQDEKKSWLTSSVMHVKIWAT
jgi:hypothetical protein